MFDNIAKLGSGAVRFWHESPRRSAYDVGITPRRYESSTTFSKESMETELTRTRYAGQAMDVYFAKWEQLSSQVDVVNASVHEGLLITMLFESFGNHSKSEYGSTASEFLSKDTFEWQTV